MKKRLISAILVLLMAAGAVPTYAKDAYPEFYISERDYDRGPASGLKSASVTDSYYFDRNLHTPAQDQKSTSVCWAFVQNELIAANLSKKTGKSGTEYDFSEQTMKFETSYVTNPEWGYAKSPNGGGNEFMSTAFLAQSGSVYEKDEPFNESEVRTADPDTLTRHGYLKNTFMYEYGVFDPGSALTDTTQKMQMYQDKIDAIAKIKELILEYGAVGASIYYDATPTYENAKKTTYNYTGTALASNHSVTIVGWDDNCPADSFKKTPTDIDGQPINGAFIVKNSWGDYHSGNSEPYVKVSYYDKHITSQLFVTDYELTNDVYDKVYQYDGFGWAQNGLVRESSVLCITKYNADKMSEKLSGVSTYVTNGGTDIEVMVNVSGEKDDKYAYKTVAKQHCEDAGYYFFEFEPMALARSEYFVAIRFTSGEKNTEFAMQNNVPGLITGSMNVLDTCFIGTDFTNLRPIEDVYRNSQPMLCMKAYTQVTEDTTPPSGKNFADVASGRWYTDYIEYCVSHGIFSGVSETHFEPQTAMTRAMFVRVLANLSGEEIQTADSPFTDVERDRWYTDAVSWAYKNGIVSGIDEKTFAPNSSITREQMCFMLTKFADHKGIVLRQTVAQKEFTDKAQISKYAKNAVALCQMSGIINGMTDGSFAPKKSATRAEVSVLLTGLAKNYIY